MGETVQSVLIYLCLSSSILWQLNVPSLKCESSIRTRLDWLDSLGSTRWNVQYLGLHAIAIATEQLICVFGSMEDVTSQLAELQTTIQNIEAQLNDNHIRRAGDETMHTLDRCQLQKKLAKLRQEEAALVERRRISCVVHEFLREHFRSASSSCLLHYM